MKVVVRKHNAIADAMERILPKLRSVCDVADINGIAMQYDSETKKVEITITASAGDTSAKIGF